MPQRAKITGMFSAVTVASVSKPTVPDAQKQVNIEEHGGDTCKAEEQQVSDSEANEGQSKQESIIETFHCTVNYTVIEPEEKQDDNNKAGLPDWGTALIVIGIMIVGALIAAWFYCPKTKNRSSCTGKSGMV